MTFNIIQRGNVCPNFIAILALQLFTFYDENEDSPGEARVGSCIALLVCWVLISLSLVTGHVFARVMGAQWAEWSCPALAPTVYFPQLMVQQTPGPQFVSCCNVANMGATAFKFCDFSDSDFYPFSYILHTYFHQFSSILLCFQPASRISMRQFVALHAFPGAGARGCPTPPGWWWWWWSTNLKAVDASTNMLLV